MGSSSLASVVGHQSPSASESQHKCRGDHVDGGVGGSLVKVEISVASWADLDTLILGLFPHKKFRRVTVQMNLAGSCEANLKDGSE